MSVSPEHQQYIQTKVNPLLESLVTAILLEKPADPLPFMIDWLKKKDGTAAIEEALKSELETLKSEIKSLEKKLKGSDAGDDVAVAAAAPAAAGGDSEKPAAAEEVDPDLESEEDNDDDVDDDFKPPEAYLAKQGKPRASVSAEAYGKWNVKQDYVPKVVEKTDEQKDRLKAKLGLSFMFQNLEPADFDVVVGAMEEMNLEAGQRIITKGDDGDCMYVVDSGSLDCKIPQEDGSELVVKTVEEGDVFGELALLYNCPRAAHVDSKDASLVWKLDRECFNAVVKEAAQKKRERFEELLGKVSLFESMSNYEKSQVADALQTKTAAADEAIITQGEEGSVFYILEEGTAVALKDDAEVMQYESGMYFGELALLKGEPRAATVKATSACKLATLDRKTFKRLLGSLQDIMDRKAGEYK